jgi:pyruvate/2-oxoglutarate dehydrogenase complex dihydrolipoamide dehydrogenase (E3) component
VEQYDAIVIGAGQAGGPLSTALANSGHKTALIEREHVGGTCINEGCTPTKTMVASARVAYLARRAADYGVTTGPVTVDQEVVRQRKRQIVTQFRSGSEKRLWETEGLDLLFGEACFTGAHSLQVALKTGQTRELTADLIFINTGGRPSAPKIEGLDDVPHLDSTTIMELDETPGHLIVLGGGYIGLEYAQMFRRFGSEVTVVHRGGQLLNREDEDIAECIRGILEEDGIAIRLNTEASQVRMQDDHIALTVRSGDSEELVRGTHLLVATGRTPNTGELNLAAAGLETDKRGYVRVNERLETNVPGIYALGDVNGGPAFTHVSYDDFRIIRANLIEGGSRTTSDRPLPYCVFTDPELGRIGITEREAREQGLEIEVATMPMSSVARALESDETRGLMKAIVDVKTGQILGAAILGLWGGEVMTQIQLAMMGDLPYPVLRDAVIAHPTIAESLSNLFATLDG